MKRKFACAAMACFTAAALSLPVYASPSEAGGAASAETSASEQAQLNYIHTDLEESYISSYGLYEQVMYGQIVFYTNIENGGVTSDSVVVELPAELETTFTRDGEEVTFTNKAEISEVGAYSLTVIAKGENILGGAENDRYYSLFRFRIMEQPADVNVDTDIEIPEWSNYDDVDTSDDNSDVSGDNSDISGDNSDVSGDNSDSADDGASDLSPDDNPDDNAGDLPVDSGSDGTGNGGSGDGSGNSGNSGGDSSESTGSSGITQEAIKDCILVTTEAGSQIHSSIPADAKTSGAVKISVVSNVQYELYRDGELLVKPKLSNITNAGKYSLRIYDAETPARFEFEITSQYISKLEEYTVPDGCEITSALYEGNPIRAGKTSVQLGSDGSYSFDVEFGEYSYTDTITLDNTPPEFGFDRVEDGVAAGGTVTVILQSDDIAGYQIYLDGELMAKQKLAVSEPGEYTVYVYDRAGNISQQSFELEYRMDAMAIVVIIILVGIVVAGVVFFLVSRRKFIIR